MKRTRVISVLAISLAVACSGAVLRAAPATQPTTVPATQSATSPFLHFVDDGRGGGRLESGVVTYRNDKGVAVRLVAAVHIAEKAYFEQLAKDFESDDAVLYELVKAKDAPLPKPGAGYSSEVSQLQRFLKDTLDLEFQLDVIDYTRANFVHADLDAEKFKELQASRGESFASLMLQSILDAMAQPAAGNGDPNGEIGELIQAIARPDAKRQIKLLVARRLGDIESMAAGLDGPHGSVILSGRNDVAMKVLQQTIAGGKSKISVFYGAAHMPDLSKRLAEMGFKEVAAEWRPAWDLEIRPNEPSILEDLLTNIFSGLEEENGTEK